MTPPPPPRPRQSSSSSPSPPSLRSSSSSLSSSSSAAAPVAAALAPLFSPRTLSSFVGAAGNLSIQYNLSVLSIALAFAGSHATSTAKGLAPDLPQPAWAKYSLLGMVFVGTILGMVLLGIVGDVFGRRAGMLASLSLVVGGALASALLSWGAPDAAYGVIVVCRLIIGAGVGGIYPNAAAISAESAGEGEDGGERVGFAFFWQSPGAIAPYLLAWLLLATPASTPAVTSLQFRVLLAAGALPAGAVLIASSWLARDVPQEAADESGGGGKAAAPAGESALALAMARPELLRSLAGTAGTWLLYDISYYGTAIFTPQILDSIFGEEATLADLCWQAIVKEIAGLAGVLAAIAVMRRLGGRWLNVWGFLLLAALFAAFGLLYEVAPGSPAPLNFGVFCLLSCALNWGPNVATYCLPAQIFPKEVRASFHGISAASGKVGAIIGTFSERACACRAPARAPRAPARAPRPCTSLSTHANLFARLHPLRARPAVFAPIRAASGVAAIMWVQVAVCLLGAVLSYSTLPDNSERDAPVLWCGRFFMHSRAHPAAAKGAGASLRKLQGVGEVVSNPITVVLASAGPPRPGGAGEARRERMRAARALDVSKK